MKAYEVIAALDRDAHPRSALVGPGGDGEVFVQFEGRGCMWVRPTGRYVSGWTPHGQHHWREFGLINRLRIRAALRRWAARRGPPA